MKAKKSILKVLRKTLLLIPSSIFILAGYGFEYGKAIQNDGVIVSKKAKLSKKEKLQAKLDKLEVSN